MNSTPSRGLPKHNRPASSIGLHTEMSTIDFMSDVWTQRTWTEQTHDVGQRKRKQRKYVVRVKQPKQPEQRGIIISQIRTDIPFVAEAHHHHISFNADGEITGPFRIRTTGLPHIALDRVDDFTLTFPRQPGYIIATTAGEQRASVQPPPPQKKK